MRISDWSSDVCSSDLTAVGHHGKASLARVLTAGRSVVGEGFGRVEQLLQGIDAQHARPRADSIVDSIGAGQGPGVGSRGPAALRMPAALDDDDRLAACGNARDRKSVVMGKSVSVRVGHAVDRILKTKKRKITSKKQS